MKFIGDNLRKFRTEYNYTRNQFAKKLKVSNRTIQNWEEDFTNPDANCLAKMTKILNKDFRLFFEPVEYKGKKSRNPSLKQ